MTTYRCPTCQRFFGEAGFCPFDGSPLGAPVTDDGAATLPSMAMPAQGAPDAPTQVPPALRTEVPTGAPTGVASPTAAPPAAGMPVYRAVSAAESTGAAVAAIASRLSEYDRLVGQVLDGRYHIERKLGEGGMGVVFAARHAVIERPLAIKVLKREVMRDTATIKRFVQEAKAASRIGHPNIVDVTDFGTTTDGLTYQVMEFVDGVTLGTALREGAPFSGTRTARIAAQLARALGAAHTKGIVHRDLKPENIFLVARDGRRDFVKVVDFGIAKVVPVDGQPVDGPRLTRAGAVFGTPEYMAPEQAAGRGDTDGRVDIYALGIIMYEMLTGRVPHRGDTMVRTLAMQMLDPVEPPSRVRPDLTIRPELEAVVMKALAKKREQRYQTMAELVADLERAVGGALAEPVSASVVDGKAMSLPPVPPGADPAVAASTGAVAALAVPAATSDRASGAVAHPADGRHTERRYRDEPAFVSTAGTSPILDAIDEPPPRPPPSRWPLALAAAMVLAAGGVGLALYLRGDERRAPVAAAPLDAPVAPRALADAAPTIVADVPVDAAVHLDAPAPAPRRDARTRRVDAGPGAGTHLTPRGDVAVKVVTVPRGGAVYDGYTFKGTSEPTIELPYGTRARIRCTLRGYEEGKVDLVFDGSVDTAACVMKRIVRCVDDTPDHIGLKNPVDDCPDARTN